ncbi:MAG: hypothetical protein HYY17_12830 [Planctomycetes bacterium]|nr:hypothetical protein [Planctomycetota bacterium]
MASLLMSTENPPLTIPLKGLTAKCCEKPVEEALGRMPNVESVKLRKDGSLYYADISLKAGYGVPISEIDKALGEANKEMGDAMGTKYVLDDSLLLSQVHLFKTKNEPEESKIKSALSKLPGFKVVVKQKTGFTVVFEGEKQPTAVQVRKGCGVEVTDVILAASKDGARYSCPMHPETASPAPGKCPECGMDMYKVATSRGGPQPKKDDKTDDKPKKKGG